MTDSLDNALIGEDDREDDAPPRLRPMLDELYVQAALALPLAFTLLCRFAQGFVDLAVVGRLLGTDALAGASLALTFLFALTNIVTGSCGDATAALCAQALGAGEARLCGAWLQLGMLSSSAAVLLVLAPAWALVGAPLRREEHLKGVVVHVQQHARDGGAREELG